MILENISRGNRKDTTISWRYSKKQLLQNPMDYMLSNSISVDIKVDILRLKEKSTTGVFHGILRSFRTANLENNFEGLLLKKNRGGEGLAVILIFTFSRAVIHKSWNNLLSPQIFTIWIMLFIFIKVRKDLVV